MQARKGASARFCLLILTYFLAAAVLGVRVAPVAPAGDVLAAGVRVQPACADSPPAKLEAGWFPHRQAGAATGTEFGRKTTGWRDRDRQEAALSELRSGNIPDFLRILVPVRLSYKYRDGREINAVVWVTPDYLSIGSDEDFLRIPLTRPSAVSIASELNCVLPTRKIVDAIYEQADFHFRPMPMPPTQEMRSSRYYLRHNAMIEESRKGRPLGELLAGHKKDIVLTNKLQGRERIAIYGWHRQDGQPIQGLSTVHAARYADYSHGLRLVYGQVCVNGKMKSFYEVLQDPQLAPVLSYEGPIPRIMSLMKW